MLKIDDATIERISDDIVDLIKQGRLLKRDAESDGWQGEEDLEVLWYNYIKRVDPHEKKYIVIINSMLTRQAKEVFDNIKKYPDNYKKWMFNKKKWLSEFTDAEVKFIVKLYKQEGQKAIDLALKLSRKSYYKAEEVPISIAFDVYNPEVTDELIKQTTRFPAGVVGTSEEIIRREIANGLELGESIYELKKRVTERLGPTYIKNRAEMIARSETIYASNAGAELGYMQSGVVEGKKWLAALDERTCDPCTDMNNMTAPIGQPTWEKEGLDVSGVQSKYDLDFDYTEGAMPFPPLHPRCRCTITPIVKVIEKPTLGNLQMSDANLEQLRRESKFNSIMFDQNNNISSAAITKQNIADALTEKLKDNVDFVEYVKRLPGWSEQLTSEQLNSLVNHSVSDLIRQWAGTSGDANMHAISMQIVAQREFNLSKSLLSHFSAGDLKFARLNLEKNGKAFQAFIRAQYNLTQEFFKKQGITSLTGYRGVAFSKKIPGFQFGDDLTMSMGKLQLQPMSSFSTDVMQAKSFTYNSYKEYKMLTQSKVPVNRILSTAQTGFGCKREAEFVMLGGQDLFKVATMQGEFKVTGKFLDTIDDFLKTFADFKVPKVPVWKPTMSVAEAKVWTKGSIYEKDILYHGSPKADKLLKEGFKIQNLGKNTGNGGLGGAGHYVTSFKNTASLYTGKGKVVDIKVKSIKELLHIDPVFNEIYEKAGDLVFPLQKYDNLGDAINNVLLSRQREALKKITSEQWIRYKKAIYGQKFKREMLIRDMALEKQYDTIKFVSKSPLGTTVTDEIVVLKDNLITVIKE